MYFTKRTDMAVEFTEKCKTEEVSHREYELYGMTITDTSVTKEGGEVIGKPQEDILLFGQMIYPIRSVRFLR